MKTQFSCVDVDKDGTLTKNDYEEFGRRFAEHQQLDEEKAKAVSSYMLEFWSMMSNGNDDLIITENQYVDLMKIRVFDPAFHKAAVDAIHKNFTVLDANGDGSIDWNEFVLYFKSLGRDEESAKMAFEAIDVNQDGLITLEEFTENYLAFLTTEDEEHSSKFCWGPLI